MRCFVFEKGFVLYVLATVSIDCGVFWRYAVYGMISNFPKTVAFCVSVHSISNHQTHLKLLIIFYSFSSLVVLHSIVDKITDRHGTKGMTTIRGKDQTINPFIYRMRRGYAFYQFMAYGSMLTHSPR